MSQDYPGVYLPGSAPNIYQSTPLANAGWYEEGQHGGALSALVVGHIERHVPTLTAMEINRATVEIFRVIPLVDLRIETQIVREGKRIQNVDARIYDPEGTLLSMASVQRLRTDDLPLPEDAVPPRLDMPGPDDIDDSVGDAWGVGTAGKVMFHRHAMEIREIFGGFEVKGPGAVWMRLRKPIVAGEEATPLQRAVATADFCNGISRGLDYNDWVFMNPDLTVHTSRYPEGEWVALSAESAYESHGRGIATGTLWDTKGLLGRSTQSLYIDVIEPS